MSIAQIITKNMLMTGQYEVITDEGFLRSPYRSVRFFIDPFSQGRQDEIEPRWVGHQKVGFDVFEHGIIKRRVLAGQTEEDDGWKRGHPILFPIILVVGALDAVNFQFRVPMDDTHTAFHFIAFGGDTTPDQESWRKFNAAQVGLDRAGHHLPARLLVARDHLRHRVAIRDPRPRVTCRPLVCAPAAGESIVTFGWCVTYGVSTNTS